MNLIRIFYCLTVLWISIINTLFAQNSTPKAPISQKYAKDTIHIDDDSTHYKIDNLGEYVNEGHVSSGPRISPDGKHLYFFKINHPENLKGTRDIWVSDYNTADSTWSKAYHFGQPLNNYGDNSVHWISEDGNTLLLHNIYLKNKLSKNGVSISTKLPDGSWSFPKKLKIKGYKNKDVCSFDLSADQKVLISAITQPNNTLGKQDLYVSFKTGEFEYSEPKNMGAVINTSGAEATAFIAPDGKTIYFSSNGHPGSFGGFDIYETHRLDSSWTSWSKPRHIGAPFNTHDDDFYFSAPDETDYVYLSRHFGHGNDQHSDVIRIRIKEIDPKLALSGKVFDDFDGKAITATVKFVSVKDNIQVDKDEVTPERNYQTTLIGKKKFIAIIEAPGYQTRIDTFDLTNQTGGLVSKEQDFRLKREPALVLNGKTFSSKDNSPLESEIIITNKSTGDIIYNKKLGKDEPYDVKLPAGAKYDIKVKSKEFLTEEVEIDLTDQKVYEEKKKDWFLKHIEKGLKFTVENIYFEFGKADLKPESFVELDKLVSVLKDAPNIKVEISAHTDWIGNDLNNMTLSQKRAKSVVEYMIKMGIVAGNLVSKGYGETKPIADNNKDEGRAKNRRVEFKILDVKE